MLTAALSLSLALSCGGPGHVPGGLEACEEPGCRADWILATWASDPEAVKAEIAALPQGLERDVTIRVLTERDADAALALCQGIGTLGVGEPCRRLLTRPHLSQPKLHASRSRQSTFQGHHQQVVGP